MRHHVGVVAPDGEVRVRRRTLHMSVVGMESVVGVIDAAEATDAGQVMTISTFRNQRRGPLRKSADTEATPDHT